MISLNKNFVSDRHIETNIPVSAPHLNSGDITTLPEDELLANALIDENKNDYDAAIEKYVFLVDQGSVKAEDRCKEMLKAGCGVTQTFAYCERADNENSAGAAFILGNMYFYGYGVELDYYKAVECYERGDNRGNGFAAFRHGNMYFYGYGVELDYYKAVACYERGDNRGNGFAAFNHGVMYHFSYGVEQNYKKAVACYRRGIELGCAWAVHNLGLMYERGQGVQHNDKTALDYYKKAADEKISKASDRILWMCLDGRAQKVDLRFTVEFLKKAAKNGNKQAEEKLQGDLEIQTEIQEIRVEKVRQVHFSRYVSPVFPEYLTDKNKPANCLTNEVLNTSEAETFAEYHDRMFL